MTSPAFPARVVPLDWCVLGAIAQLGERLLCKQEVDGSIPSGSIREVPGNQPVLKCATGTKYGRGRSGDEANGFGTPFAAPI
jgi:hypothetical protein